MGVRCKLFTTNLFINDANIEIDVVVQVGYSDYFKISAKTHS